MEQFKSIVAVPGVVLPPIVHIHFIFPGVSSMGVLSPAALDSFLLGRITFIEHWAPGRVAMLSWAALEPRLIGEVIDIMFIKPCPAPWGVGDDVGVGASVVEGVGEDDGLVGSGVGDGVLVDI